MTRIDDPGAVKATLKRERRAQMNEYVILSVLFFFLVTYTMQWWRISQAIKIDSIRVENMRVVSSANLCPGESLIVRFDLGVQGFGIIIWDATTEYKGSPTMFSDAGRLPVDGPATLTLNDEWVIPPAPDMMVAGTKAWTPGPYTRLVTLAASSSFVSRFVEPQRVEVPFTIRENCP